MNFKSKRQSIRGERGQAMTEFVIILPLLAILLFGIVQFGIVFNNYVTLTDGTRAGARKAVVGRFTSNPAAQAEAAVRSSAPNLDQGQLAVSVSGTFQAGTNVSVTATYPYSISLLGVVVKSGQLTSVTTERVE